MKKTMWTLTFVSLAGLCLSGTIYSLTKEGLFYSFVITFGTVLYHFAMRLFVGGVIDARFRNHMNYKRKWFAVGEREQKFYGWLRVKNWKKHLPSYNPQDFDIRLHSLSEIVQTSCQAEIVHEIIIVLSFVPPLFSFCFGSLGVFLITSLAAALFDGIFVVMQRYNRPRLLRLMERQSARAAKKESEGSSEEG